MIRNPRYRALWRLLGITLWVNSLLFILLGVLFEKESIVMMAYFTVGFAFVNSIVFFKALKNINQKSSFIVNNAVSAIILCAVIQYIFTACVLCKR